MPGHFDDRARLPRDFTVEDILRAPPHRPRPHTPDAAEQAEGEARSALWEMDFAIQEFDWLNHGVARADELVASIASQLAYSASCLERYPVDLLPLPDDLGSELADRFARLSDALEDVDPQWAADQRLAEGYERLRTSLELRGVEI